LSIDGNELRITIPEQWFSEAAYPVIVDPVVGTNTIGSQTIWYDPDNEDYYELFNEFRFGLNRFLIPETFIGNATAYVYAYHTDYWGRCQPIIFSDNNNVPQTRRSSNEGTFDIEVRSGKPAGWRSASIRTNTSLTSGTFIWFGVYCDWFAMRFDWGAKCYRDGWEESGLPNTYPLWRADNFYDFKLSMYFEYTNAQNYIRTLTQGVSLSDNRRMIADYKRNTTHTVRATATPKGIRLFLLTIVEAVRGMDKIAVSVFYFRSLLEKATATENANSIRLFFRGLFENVKISSEEKSGWIIPHRLTETVHAADRVSRGLMLLVRIVTGAFVRDYIIGRFLKARSELALKSCITREIVLDSRIY
ncbi:MAG: hypothetical protein LBE79_07630, partial [Tannerella sp.]|jgi:hypothetical protein|nr:hypothetical protein [Tannerella sp.]